MMASSIFGVERCISEPLSAVAVLTGRHRENKHARPCFSHAQIENARVHTRGESQPKNILKKKVSRGVYYSEQLKTLIFPLPADVLY